MIRTIQIDKVIFKEAKLNEETLTEIKKKIKITIVTKKEKKKNKNYKRLSLDVLGERGAKRELKFTLAACPRAAVSESECGTLARLSRLNCKL